MREIDLSKDDVALEVLRKDCLACRQCSIGGCDHGAGISNVFSNMNAKARIMVVGQNPGADEVVQGTPFVGASGKFFDKAIKDICGLERSDLYITNTVKCLTPENRKPKRDEFEACQQYLDKEVELVKPDIIIALGALAFKRLTGMKGIMKHQGEFIYSVRYNVNVLALLHPSPYNTNNPERREMFNSGLEKLNDYLKEAEVGACG
jgi:DNA polymerase